MFELTIQRFPSATKNNSNNKEPKALIENEKYQCTI